MTDDAAFDGPADVLGGNAQSMLRSTVERIERLLEDKAAVMEDIKEVKAEAKGNGLDPAVVMKVIKIRSMDRAKRQEAEAILHLYLNALGIED